MCFVDIKQIPNQGSFFDRGNGEQIVQTFRYIGETDAQTITVQIVANQHNGSSNENEMENVQELSAGLFKLAFNLSTAVLSVSSSLQNANLTKSLPFFGSM